MESSDSRRMPFGGTFRFILISLLLSLWVFPIAADNQNPYVIDTIEFSISGKSSESMLRKTLSFKEGDAFSTFEELQNAVASNRQGLFNRRIFDKVDAAIVPVDESQNLYKIVFSIIDAFTILALPYPKYDSNYGAKLGLKVYDKNFLGILSNFYFNAQVRQLAVDDFSNYHLESYLDITNLQIFSKTVNLNSSVTIDYNQGLWEKGQLASSISIGDLRIGLNSFDVSAGINAFQMESDAGLLWGDYNMNFGVTWRGLSFLTQDINLSATANMITAGQNLTDSNFTISSFISLPSFILLTPEISLYAADNYSFPFDDWENPTAHTIEAGLSDTHTFLGFQHTMTLFTASNFLPDPFTTIDAGIRHSMNGGRIDWHDNLRKGKYLDISFSTSTPVDSGFDDAIEEIKTVTRFTATYFFKAGSLLSLGIKANGFVATHDKATFGYAPGDQIRGILNKNIPDQWGYKGLVLNTNLTMKMFDFTLYVFNKSPDGQLLFSPFFDMAYLDQTSSDITTFAPDLLRYSAGFEFYIIFDSYRSYPLCASFGFDLEDALAVLNKEMDAGDMEFEIVLSLNMLY